MSGARGKRERRKNLGQGTGAEEEVVSVLGGEGEI